jgi:hypothetical protein
MNADHKSRNRITLSVLKLDMSRFVPLIIWLFSLAHCRLAKAADSPHSFNRYQLIAQKNVFRLRSPPPPPHVEPPRPPLADITLTGITTVLGDKRVLLKIHIPARPLQPAKDELCTLSEGQRSGEIEILKVDRKAEAVTVNNSGTVMTITFDKGGPKTTQSVPPPSRLRLPLHASAR